MLSASARGPYFAIYGHRFDVPVVDPIGLTTWKPGKKLSGVTQRGRPMTDGTRGDIFAGCPWLQKWDRRPGYRLLTVSRLPFAFFTEADVPAIFVGRRLFISKQGASPALIALPARLLLKDCEIPRRVDSRGDPLWSEGDGWIPVGGEAVLHAIAAGAPIDARLGDRNGRRAVRPRRPLSRAEWRLAGFHIPTLAAAATADEIVPIFHGATLQSVPLPFVSQEAIEANGFAGCITQLSSTTAGEHALLDQVTIVDPARAGKTYPFLLTATPGTVLRPMTHHFADSAMPITLSPGNAEALIQLPALMNFGPSDVYSPCVSVGMDAAAIRVRRGAKLITNTRAYGLAVLIEASRVESVLIAARKLSATRVIPANATTYAVIADGTKLQGRYYLREAANAFEFSKQRNRRLNERESRLSALHQRELPHGWQEMKDSDVAACVLWDLRKKEGWVVKSELSKLLRGFTWSDDAFPLASVDAPIRPRLFRPISIKDLIAHPSFAAAALSFWGDGAAFTMACIMNEDVRCALAAHAFES